MFHDKDGARMHVLCLGCSNWNGHSCRLSISKEGDEAFQAGMVAGGIRWWDTLVSDTQVQGKTMVNSFSSGHCSLWG